MNPQPKIVALAGGSGFIGRAIVRRLAASEDFAVRVLTRNPDRARARIGASERVTYATADLTDADGLAAAIAGAAAIINAAQFDGYPVENPRRGLTFNRVDYNGTIALIAAAKSAGAAKFIYLSGAAADDRSPNPAFRSKGRAERAIRDAGIDFTILRPSMVYGPEDRVVNGLARAIRYAPVMIVPGHGQQKVQPVLVDDVAACVALAAGGRGLNGVYEIGGPEAMTFDALVRLIMEITGRRRPIVHIPERLLRIAGTVAQRMPGALFSADAVDFLVSDSQCNIKPLLAEFGVTLMPARIGLAYLAKR